MTSQTELAFAYLAHYRTKDDSLSWAWEAVDDAMHELELGLPICLELIEATESDALCRNPIFDTFSTPASAEKQKSPKFVEKSGL